MPQTTYIPRFKQDAEFNNLNVKTLSIDGAAVEGGVVLGVGQVVDLNGNADALVIDADGDTTISAPTDDQIDIEVAGADDFRITANTFTALAGSTIATNTIAETTAAQGVTVDGVLLKDSGAVVTSLQVNDNRVASVAFTVNAEDADANTITVNCQFNQGSGAACAARNTLYFFLSDDANGDSIAATAPSGGIAAGTDGFIDEITSGKSFFGSSESDGDLDIVITEVSIDTWYLVAVLPNGLRSISAAITFA